MNLEPVKSCCPCLKGFLKLFLPSNEGQCSHFSVEKLSVYRVNYCIVVHRIFVKEACLPKKKNKFATESSNR